jgi:SnoaL-like protein
MDRDLQETVDFIAIRRLQSAYADIVTRRAWPQLAEIFLPDAVVVVDKMAGDPIELVGPEGVGGFISEAIAHFDFFEFVILNTVIDIDGDTASARMYIWELRHDPAGGRSNAYGLYRDRYARVDGRWWFAGRRYQSLARTVAADYAVFPLPEE